jgi:prepilin-type N-terminal cleavage/methylation domain-containing protein
MLQKLTRKNEEGFTLIELMIVIAIIGILAAIAIPNFIQYRKRSYNTAANADTKNLYTASQAYFTDNPTGQADLPALKNYGFRQTSDVSLAIGGTTQSSFSATAYHGSGDKTYSVIFDGQITG